MKKLLILGLGILSCMLMGCKADNSKKLVVWSNMQVEADTLVKYGELWSKKTGNSIEVIHETPDLQQFVQATNSKNGPDAVIGIPNDQLANFVTAKLVSEVPLELYDDNDYVRASVDACYVDGKRYGVPIAVETVALFYNTDKIETPPSTWDELITMAKENGGFLYDATSIYYNLGFVRAYDSFIFPFEDGTYDVSKLGLGNEGAVKAYQYIESLGKEHGLISSNVTLDIAKSSFQNGETAFYIGGPWDVAGFTNSKTPFAVTTLPTLNNKEFVTPVGTQVSFVSNKSAKQEMAWDFIMYLVEEAGMELYEVGDRIPAKLSLQNMDEIQNNDISRAFTKQINMGEPMPTVAEIGQVWAPFTNNMKAMLNGDITPEIAAKNIEKQIIEGINLMNSGK